MAVTKITLERVEEMRQDLASLPPPPQPAMTKREVVIVLAPLIRDMQTKRYRLEDILPVLNKRGENFTVASLRTYIARAPKLPAEASKAAGVVAPDASKAVTKRVKASAASDVGQKKGAEDQGKVSQQQKPAETVSKTSTDGEQEGAEHRAPVPDDAV